MCRCVFYDGFGWLIWRVLGLEALRCPRQFYGCFAAKVYMSQAQDISDVPGLGELIEGKIIQERIDEAEMPDAKTYTMDEVKAHLEKWSKEQHPSAYWHQIPWGDSTD